MEKQTFGDTLAKLRKEQGMTQLELAEKMGVTDKAVSKWERNLSFPDISSISRLSEIFHVTTDELLQQKTAAIQKKDKKLFDTLSLICKAVAVAMGIAVVVLS